MMAAKDLPSAPRMAARPRIDSKEALASFDVSGIGGTAGACVLDRYRGALVSLWFRVLVRRVGAAVLWRAADQCERKRG